MGPKMIFLFSAIALLVAACGSATAPGGPISVNRGQDLFVLNCGECHGNDGTGTDEAPIIIGHSAEQVLEQVRTPEGDMKAILPAKLPDAELNVIAEYVAGLSSGGQAHEEEISPSEEESIHLMAAYMAIVDYENMDREAGIQHLEQAAALGSAEAAELYEELAEAIKNGKAGTARHELKELLGMMDMG